MIVISSSQQTAKPKALSSSHGIHNQSLIAAVPNIESKWELPAVTRSLTMAAATRCSGSLLSSSEMRNIIFWDEKHRLDEKIVSADHPQFPLLTQFAIQEYIHIFLKTRKGCGIRDWTKKLEKGVSSSCLLPESPCIPEVRRSNWKQWLTKGDHQHSRWR